MRYSKPPLTFEQQADQLLARGMAGDRDQMTQRLGQVSYYRLSGYWYPFRQLDPNDPSHVLDDFKPGTTFDEVWSRYVFDRQLRLLVLDAIERIEVAVRSQLAFHHSHQFGLFDYATDPATLPGCNSYYRANFLHNVQAEVSRSKDTFVEHFQAKYGDTHTDLPVWMAVEIMTFGSVLTFYSGSPHKIKQAIASTVDMPDKVFAKWLLTLNTVRNICAHHGRLWNRVIGTAPMIPRKKQYPTWHQPQSMKANRVYAVLTICKWSLDRIAQQSQWSDRLRTLLSAFPNIPLTSMGFPTDWTQCPIWTPPEAAAQGTLEKKGDILL